jgi:hypothetical protein
MAGGSHFAGRGDATGAGVLPVEGRVVGKPAISLSYGFRNAD